MIRYCLGISLLVLTIIIVRSFSDNKISKRLQYALWLLIPLYMLVSPIMAINITVPVKEDTVVGKTVAEAADRVFNVSDETPVPLDTGSDAEEQQSIEPMAVMKIVYWAVSAVIITGVADYNIGFIVYCHRRRVFLKVDQKTGLKIFKFDHPSSPFLLGKDIYLTEEVINSEMYRYAVCHEYCHYRHFDHIWSVLRYIVLALNWYNPLIWCAIILAGDDCEYACDEAVVAMLGEDEKGKYGRVLLKLLAERNHTKPDIYLSTAMNGRSKRFMKKRISNIKRQNGHTLTAAVIVAVVILAVSGCSLVKLDKEAVETESEHETSSVEETTTVAEESETTPSTEPSEVSEMVVVPEVDTSLSDGYYTVEMLPDNILDGDGKDTCMFYPWTQYEVDQEYIDSLEEGQILDLSEWEGFDVDGGLRIHYDSATIQSIGLMGLEPERFLGTDYTGEITNLVTDVGNLNFYKVKDSDKWKLFFEGDVPVLKYSELKRVILSDDCIIYDAYTWWHTCDLELSQEELESAIQFINPEYTEGLTDSVEEFFGEWDYSSYTNTVVRIENNEVTEIYFYTEG